MKIEKFLRVLNNFLRWFALEVHITVIVDDLGFIAVPKKYKRIYLVFWGTRCLWKRKEPIKSKWCKKIYDFKNSEPSHEEWCSLIHYNEELVSLHLLNGGLK
jgi:hypothetical protein